jgi:uncharacterized damage-inducible protein DinB
VDATLNHMIRVMPLWLSRRGDEEQPATSTY